MTLLNWLTERWDAVILISGMWALWVLFMYVAIIKPGEDELHKARVRIGVKAVDRWRLGI